MNKTEQCSFLNCDNEIINSESKQIVTVETKKEVLELEIPTGQPLWYEMENEKLAKATIKN